VHTERNIIISILDQKRKALLDRRAFLLQELHTNESNVALIDATKRDYVSPAATKAVRSKKPTHNSLIMDFLREFPAGLEAGPIARALKDKIPNSKNPEKAIHTALSYLYKKAKLLLRIDGVYRLP